MKCTISDLARIQDNKILDYFCLWERQSGVIFIWLHNAAIVSLFLSGVHKCVTV